jgi:hypothetical protein
VDAHSAVDLGGALHVARQRLAAQIGLDRALTLPRALAQRLAGAALVDPAAPDEPLGWGAGLVGDGITLATGISLLCPITRLMYTN